MADIRIKDLPTTATQTSSDDFIALDGTTNGTRKLSAYNPSFGGAITGVSLTAPTTTNLTLAGGSTGATVVIGQGTTAASATITPTGTGNLLLQTNAQIPTTGCFQINNTSGAAVWQAFTSGATTMASFSRSSNALLIKGGGGAGAQVSVGYTGEDLTLAGGSTGASLVLGQGANGNATLALKTSARFNLTAPASNDAYIEYVGNAGTAGTTSVVVGQSGAGLGVIYNRSNSALTFGTNSLERGRFTDTGNLLIGTTTDSGNGKLQLATHTTSAGGIGFGTDNQLFRYGSSQLALTNSSGTSGSAIASNMQLRVENSGNGGIQVNVPDASTGGVYFGRSTDAYYAGIERSGTNLQLRNAGTTALTIDSSQNLLTSSGAILYTNRVYNLTGGATPLAIGWTGSAAVLNIFSSGAATFAGAVTTGGAINVTNGGGTFVANSGSNSNQTVLSLTNGGAGGTNYQIQTSTSAGTTAGGLLIYDNNAAAAAISIAGTSRNVGILSTTPSTGAGSGALQVAGGIYSGANSYFTGQITSVRPFMATGSIAANMTSAGGIGFAGGGANVFSFGANASTTGAFSVQLVSSDASLNFNALTIAANTGAATFAGTVIAPAATTAISSVRLPHGAAPTAPVNGDMWTTTAGLYVRINGVTVGPLS